MLRYFSLDKWAVLLAKGLRNGKRLHWCQVSTVMIYNSLHLQYEVCRCRWDMHWNWVSECERIQLLLQSLTQLDTLEMVREWTHSLHMAKPSATTSKGGYAWAFITYPCIIQEKFSETLKPHCCFRNGMFPHHSEVIPLWEYLCAPIINLLALHPCFSKKDLEVYITVSTTETILNDFTECYRGRRYSQVNKIENKLVFFQSQFLRIWEQIISGHFYTQPRLIVKLTFS